MRVVLWTRMRSHSLGGPSRGLRRNEAVELVLSAGGVLRGNGGSGDVGGRCAMSDVETAAVAMSMGGVR